MSAVIAAVYVFGIISMWDSSAGRTSVDTYKSIQAEFDSDDKFVKTIESEVSEGAMIYQLPYHTYPEVASRMICGIIIFLLDIFIQTS